MAKDMEAIINSAIDSAVDDGVLPDSEYADGDAPVVEETDGSEDTTVESGAEQEDATGDDKATPASEKKTEELDALMDELVKEGFKPRQGVQKRDNKIPYSNVQKIIGNRETRAVEAVAKAIGVDAKTLKFDGLEAAVSEKLGSYRELEARDENYRNAEDVMMNDPDRYIRILATIEPEKYGKFTKVLDTKGDDKGEKVDPDEEILREMPEMDVAIKLPDGSEAKTYSPQALQKMFVTAVRFGEKRAAQQAEGVVKPLRDEREQAERARQQDAETNAQLNAAMKWRGMDEYFDDVLTAMKEDTKQATRNGRLDRSKLKYRNLHDAYIDVVPAKLADKAVVNEQDVRKKLLEEQKKAPRSTAVGGGDTTTKTREGFGDPVTDAIHRALAKAGL